MKIFLSFMLLFMHFLASGQQTIGGKVTDQNNTAILAANVYLKSAPQNGVTTDFDGVFLIHWTNKIDTLIVSYLGFQTMEIPWNDRMNTQRLDIKLVEKNSLMDELVISAKKPISEELSVVEMTMLKDVYLNPVSQGDPLKAITSLPVSTNTDETANPALRGSSPDRTSVILNGVPVYKPVRASQLNNQGFFSLFNPQIIESQYVYASNPPLTYGNASAGLVEIETIRSLNSNQLQVSLSLASAGLLLSKSFNKNKTLLQIYGNYQFSDAFIGIQNKKIPNVKNFYTKDMGINFNHKINDKTTFNSFTYFIDEKFNGMNQSYTYEGNVSTTNQRIFSINNYKISYSKSLLNFNSGLNYAMQNFEFGNLDSKQQEYQVYHSVDYTYFKRNDFKIQTGISYDHRYMNFQDTLASFYYALSPEAPTEFSETEENLHVLETYLYSKYELNKKLLLSSGIRSRVPIDNQAYYFSAQLGLKYSLKDNQALLLSGGRYHNYSIPSFYAKSFRLLSSSQLALDYKFENSNTLIQAAIYYKREKGDFLFTETIKIDHTSLFGMEFYVEKQFYKYFNFTFSNAFVDQTLHINNRQYRGTQNLNYFFKSSLQYNHPNFGIVSIYYSNRPGSFYNEIIDAEFDYVTGFYAPIFSDVLYGANFDSYQRIDLGFSKYMAVKNNSLVVFLSINNVLNAKNQRRELYSKDYAQRSYDYYQFRTFYFGIIAEINN